MNHRCLILFLFALVLGNAVHADPRKARLSQHLSEGSLVYYGAEPVDKSVFDGAKVVILESRHWSTRSIQKLRRDGKVVISYLSVGETAANAESSRYHLISENTDWDTWRVHPGDKAWRDSVLRRARQARTRGVDGVMLDTVDVAAVHPEIQSEMVRLIEDIRRELPQRYILVNRGFSIIDELAKSIDGVLFENANDKSFTRHDYEWVEQSCRTLVRLGMPVLALDYQSRSDRRQTSEMTQRYGWSYYLAPHTDLVQLGSTIGFNDR